jgi:hypothetical protein
MGRGRTLSGGRPITFDNRYVFAVIDRSTASMEFRLGLTLKPDVNLDVYAEPFAASGHYYDYGELLAPGSRERISGPQRHRVTETITSEHKKTARCGSLASLCDAGPMNQPEK